MKVSHKIFLGTANFGLNYGFANNFKKLKFYQIKKIIDFCKKNKIYNFDTANGYGDAEKILGKQNFKKIKIQTKISFKNKKINSRKKIDLLLFQSLKKLKIKKLDCLMLHDQDSLLTKNGDLIYETLNYYKKIGIVKKIGVSFYDLSILRKTIKKFELDKIQIPYNLLNTQFNNNLIRKLKKKGVVIQARSIFLQGILVNQNIIRKLKDKKLINFLKKFYNHLQKKQITNIDYIMSYINNCKFIDEYVIGIDNLDQLKKILNFKKTNSFLKNVKFNANIVDPRKWKYKK